ncbi:membrane protein required for colicin V production [Sphingopyxis sp. YR583]|jgi:membrane protein required for colicin V production|uniref:CvpA family protein n=1 Tax=Sphingopyxis sp. YR583 TaxID=1881047 RepID=UPI0008A7765B|nr:CvpA family protein [Sphingopyxis sp. YR583]SEH13384.1 membrane protein required for colicin V production [Sphingopyxis sp. YR583]
MGSLTALDILVLTLVGGGAILGFSRGLVQEVTTLLAWVLAIAAVRFFHPLVTGLLEGWVGGEGGAAMLAFVLLFGGVFALAKWGSRAMGQRSRASLVGGFDRGLGAGFGAVKGLLIASIGFMLVTLLYDIGYGNAQRPAWMIESRTYPALNATSSAMSKVIAERRAQAREAETEAAKADGADRS